MSAKVSPTELNNVENKSMDMVGRTNSFMVNERGQQLHCWYWNPVETQPIRGLVYISHGFAEHLLWYEELAGKFSSVGILAFGHDHIGHGKSDGYRCHIATFDDYSADVLFHCDKMTKKYKGLPCFMVGHSMGGMIAVSTALRKPDLFTGVVLMGPLIRPNPEEATPFKVCAAKALATLFPYCPVGFLNDKNVTRDMEMRQKMYDDQMRYHGGLRARWTVACLEGLMKLSENIEHVQWPFLLLHGEKDLICDPDAAIEFFNMASSKDKELKIYPGAYHHLYIEYPEIRTDAIQNTVDWIVKRL